MKLNYSISIPKPCHEDWSKMSKNEKGRFCKSCCKTVVDFTHMNINEIQNYIHNNKNKRICGHIKQSQLNTINLKIPEVIFNKTWNFRRLFLLALLLTMGTTLFTCSNTDGKKQKINSIEVVETYKKSIDTILKNSNVKKVELDTSATSLKQKVKSKIKDQSGRELPFICFDKKEQLINVSSTFDILYTIDFNSYSGKDEIELTLREIDIKK